MGVQTSDGVAVTGSVPAIAATVDVGGVVVRAGVRALDTCNVAPAGAQTRGCQAGDMSSGGSGEMSRAEKKKVGRGGGGFMFWRSWQYFTAEYSCTA